MFPYATVSLRVCERGITRGMRVAALSFMRLFTSCAREQLLEVRKRRTHPLTNRIGIFALKRQTSAKKASMRSSIGFPR